MGKSFFNYRTQKRYFDDDLGIPARTNDCLVDIIDELLASIDKDQTINNLNNQIIDLQQQLDECLANGGGGGNRFQINFPGIDTDVNVVIGIEYVQYILTYGVPADGIFSRVLLDELIMNG
jgi:hypothetical protein